MSALVLSLGMALTLSAYAPQQAGSAPLPPPLEARAHNLGKLLRCAVCQGLSVADSPASMARAQYDKVRELVAQGKSDEEVKQYFVARYGEWVLLEPPPHGLNWLVWGGPLLVLAIGLFAISRLLRLSRRGPAGTPAPSSSPSVDKDYLDAIRSEVEQ